MWKHHQRTAGDKNNNNSLTNQPHQVEPSTSGLSLNGNCGTAPSGQTSDSSGQPICIVRNCGIPLASGKKYLETQLLTGERMYIVVDVSLSRHAFNELGSNKFLQIFYL